MYDPTPCYPEGFHPVMTQMGQCFINKAFRYSRTEKPVTCCFSDFRTAKHYHTRATPPTIHLQTQQDAQAKPTRPKWADEPSVRDFPLLWTTNCAPEFTWPEREWDPFKLDMFLLGNEISRQFLEVRGHSFALKDERGITALILLDLDSNIKDSNG